MAQHLRTIAEAFPGKAPLKLCIEYIDGPKVFIDAAYDLRLRPCADLEQRIAQTIGEGLVYIAKRPDALLKPPAAPKWGGRRN